MYLRSYDLVGSITQKEQDELLQKDAEARQRVIVLLAEVEREWDLKLEAEERSTALQQKVNLDAKVVARLCREQINRRWASMT